MGKRFTLSPFPQFLLTKYSLGGKGVSQTPSMSCQSVGGAGNQERFEFTILIPLWQEVVKQYLEEGC